MTEPPDATESGSADSFLRRVAFAPPITPPVTPPGAPPPAERDRTGETLGRFQIADVLGRGGMGVVYRALDLTLRRRVALKLLRSGAVEGPERRRRFLQEAQAAAAVSHPNIVTVFEAGELDGELFIAMELVDGADLRAWLAARPRTRREILDVFVMAGRGLAAAHRAGLVHRDVKPENVLIDAAGRARVADFGLAVRAAPGPDADRAPHPMPDRLAGTPGYIAPECLAGREADARADQFALCVALFEALEGHRPSEAPRASKTPRRLRSVLARGLAPHPDERFPDLDALLARIERVRARPRRAAAALAVGAAGLALWAGTGSTAPSRDAAAAEVPAAWRWAREPIREAFSRVAVPYAADAGDRVRLSLDAWTDRWSQARRTISMWPGSAAAACLAQQRQDFTAVLDLLRRADAQVVARAATIVDGLGDPARCVRGPAALAPATSPTAGDPGELSRRIADARALLSAGKYVEAAALGPALRRDTEGAPAVEADAYAVAAVASWKAGALDALQALALARWAAERARRDALSTELALSLSEAHRQRGDLPRSEEWLGHAEATLARAGGDLRLSSMALAARAQLAGLRDDRRAAGELARRALALREQALGREHLETAESLLLAASLTPFDRLGDGAALARRALDIRVAALGGEHPDVATAWERLGQQYRDRYEHPRELAVQERALRIRLAALGPHHPDVARSYWSLGYVLAQLGQDEAALERYRSAREVFDRAYGPGSVRAGVAELAIAELQAGLGDVEPAIARARNAIAQIERSLGSESASIILELCTLADLLVLHGDLAEAERLYTRALRNGDQRDPENAKVALPLVGLSRVARLRGQPAVARSTAERALRLGASLYPRDYPELLPQYQALLQIALATDDRGAARREVEHIPAVADTLLAASDPLRIEVQQAQALLAAATGERARAAALARSALDAQRARPWQVLRLAEARTVLACVLGRRAPEGARLLQDAIAGLRAAKAFGSAELALARCH